MARKINFEESGTFNQPEEKPKKTKEEEDNSVNDIFSDADRIIEGQNNASLLTPKKSRKKKKLVRGLVITLIVSIILAIVAITGTIIYAIHSFKSSFTETVAQSYLSMKNDILKNESMDETETGRLTKKLANLLTEDDIKYIIEHASNPEDIQKILQLEGGTDLLYLLPEDKKEAYKELEKEYESKKDIIQKEFEEYAAKETTEPTQETTNETQGSDETTTPTVQEPATETTDSN